jgi:hypothetical protein
MRALLSALVVFAVLLGAFEASGAERRKPKRHGSANAAVQTAAPKQIMPGRGKKSDPATRADPTFRAEDIVPDICKGCSS